MSNLTPAQEALRALAEKATPGAAFIAAANPAAVLALLDELVAARGAALFLWDRLDDIDTASDRAKSNDAAYRQIVERIQARRHEVGRVSPDGRTVEFRAHLATPAGPRGGEEGRRRCAVCGLPEDDWMVEGCVGSALHRPAASPGKREG